MAFEVVDRSEVDAQLVLDLAETYPSDCVPPITDPMNVVTFLTDLPTGLGDPGNCGGLVPFLLTAATQG
ncbi:MAG: hypothetical protein ACFB11_18165 [Paracoccaceae bacterium]